MDDALLRVTLVCLVYREAGQLIPGHPSLESSHSSDDGQVLRKKTNICVSLLPPST